MPGSGGSPNRHSGIFSLMAIGSIAATSRLSGSDAVRQLPDPRIAQRAVPTSGEGRPRVVPLFVVVEVLARGEHLSFASVVGTITATT